MSIWSKFTGKDMRDAAFEANRRALVRELEAEAREKKASSALVAAEKARTEAESFRAAANIDWAKAEIERDNLNTALAHAGAAATAMHAAGARDVLDKMAPVQGEPRAWEAFRPCTMGHRFPVLLRDNSVRCGHCGQKVDKA